MGVILTCDRCGVHSPDARGYHIANSWTTLTAKQDRGANNWQMLVCEPCYDDISKVVDKK